MRIEVYKTMSMFCSFLWMCNLLLYREGRIQIEGIGEQDAEENLWI
jgi:hypothetical protein